MAHNIAKNIKIGGEAFVSGNNKKAWHNLGTVLEGQLTAWECLQYGGLDFEVATRPALVNLPNKEGGFNQEVVPDTFVTYRTDTNDIFGTVGKRYTVVQNKDAFTFFDAITGGGEAIYETAGALGQGERIFITAKMPDYVTIDGTDDKTEFYVLLTSSHNGKGAIQALVTPVRVVCQNTLSFALNNCINKVSIRHTKNAQIALEEAHKLMGITNQYASEMNQLFNHLKTVKVSDAQVQDVIAQLFPATDEDNVGGKTANMREAMFEGYQTGVGQSGIVGTAYGLMNGVTYYFDHLMNYKDDDSKFKNIIEGRSAKMVNQSMDLILELAK